MNLLKTLRAQRAEIAREMRNLLDGNPGAHWTADKQSAFDARMTQLDRLDASIARGEREAETLRTHRVVDAAGQVGASDPTFVAYLRGGVAALSPEQRRIYNTMSTTTGSQGGYTVASDVATRFVDALSDYSGLRRVAEVIVTERGNTMPWPTSDGTAEVGELLAENAAATDADPTFGTAPLTTYKYSSKLFTVPIELLQDSVLDLEQLIFDRSAARIGRISNTHFTTGTGSGQPQGFAPAATIGKTGTTGQTLTVIHDDLVDLVHSVNSAYRQDPRGVVAFQMSDTAFKVARKLKDSSNRPLYLPGVQPEAILGYPVIVNDDVPVPAANAKSIFFGNWREAYKIRDALAVSLFRFADSTFTNRGQVGFLAFARSGGTLANTGAVKAYRHSAT